MLKEFTEIQQTEQAIRGPQFDRDHGSLWDRGSADSYYGWPRDPHWYPEGTGNGAKITNLNQYEIAEYLAGYEHNERFGHKKSWD
jgi:hypothetical protein